MGSGFCALPVKEERRPRFEQGGCSLSNFYSGQRARRHAQDFKKSKIKKSKSNGVTLMPSGGFRPGAGRPRKNPIDNKLEGKKPVKAAAKPPTAKKVEYPNVMEDYFAMAMKECGDEMPSADALRSEIETFISAHGCEGLVAPQTITDYVLNRQGFLACEAMNRKIGRMTKDLKLSPYVTAGQGYYRAMQADFNLIMHTINKHSGTGQNEEKNSFLELLLNRGF